MKYQLHQTVTWRDRLYEVYGYMYVGDKLISLWLQDEHDTEYKLTGRQLREVKV